jgi:Na+/H+-dicarboxylate symporter
MTKKKDNLSSKILIGLLIGVITGLFLGENAEFFSFFGDAFIGLLQMTVLPYIMVSLISGLGKIALSEWKKLIINALLVLSLLLFIGVLAISLLPLILPHWESASFFRPEIIAREGTFDFIKLYIPSNPFKSMADNIIPAVVLFCIFSGIALTGIPGKERLISILDIISQMLNKVNKLIIRLTPYGVFAIAASTSGTMSPEELGRLQAYILLYSMAFLLLSFVILPGLVTSMTPVKYRDFFGFSKSTLITIFATGKIIVVLPQLIENIKEMLAQKELLNEETENSADIIMPLAYPFPNLGCFVILVFVPFVAWFIGDTVSTGKMPVFLGASLLSSFVSPTVVLPFLLELLHLPSNMFQLFVVSSVYTDRIRVVLGAVHLMTLSILAIGFTAGFAKINFNRLTKNLAAGIFLWAILSFGINQYLEYSLKDAYKAYDNFVSMTLNRHKVKMTIKKISDISPRYPDVNESRYRMIIDRGSIRVGYLRDQLPFAFVNNKNQLVGFDIDMAYDLAEELGVKLVIIKLRKDEISRALREGICDIVMSGVPISLSELDKITFTRPYISQTMAFIVPDYLKKRYSSSRELAQTDTLRLAIPQWSYYVNKLQNYLPKAEISVINSPRDYFTGKTKEVDALVFSAEAGSAWTLIYPSFSVVVPKPDVVRIPLAYPIAKNNPEWLEFLNNWILLKKENGTIDGYFNYWIYGQGAETKKKRWSIIKDVLHWVD